MPPARLGLVYSHTGLRKFIDAIGAPRTRELFFTARNIGAEEALGWGLVGEVLPAAEVAARGVELAAEIAANAPLSLVGNKRVIRALLAAARRARPGGRGGARRAARRLLRLGGLPRGRARVRGEARAALAGALRPRVTMERCAGSSSPSCCCSSPRRAAHAMPTDGPADVVAAPVVDPPIAWRRRAPIGKPFAGRLVDGVQLPAEGRDFWTFDWGTRLSPNRPWRRWGTDRLVQHAARRARRVPRGQPGGAARRRSPTSRARTAAASAGTSAGSATPRTRTGSTSTSSTRASTGWSGARTRRRSSTTSSRRTSSTASSAPARVSVFTGWSLPLRGPRRVVVKLSHHDDHLHVRIR